MFIYSFSSLKVDSRSETFCDVCLYVANIESQKDLRTYFHYFNSKNSCTLAAAADLHTNEVHLDKVL